MIGPTDLKKITAIANVYTEALLEMTQVLIEWTAKRRQAKGIIGFQREVGSD